MKSKKEKKEKNIPRIIWMSGMYLILILILILVVIYKVKYEGWW